MLNSRPTRATPVWHNTPVDFDKERYNLKRDIS